MESQKAPCTDCGIETDWYPDRKPEPRCFECELKQASNINQSLQKHFNK